MSRHGRDHAGQFWGVAEAIRILPACDVALDGEVAVFDVDLVSRFQALGDPTAESVFAPPVCFAFDGLAVREEDLRCPPHEVRLAREGAGQDPVLPVRRLTAHGHEA
jgi:ATP-dependent DNA ligase